MMDNSRELAAREVLFYAECQLQAMLAANQERMAKDSTVSYTEDAFLNLAEQTRGAYRRAIE